MGNDASRGDIFVCSDLGATLRFLVDLVED